MKFLVENWPESATILFLFALLFLWLSVTYYHAHGRFRKFPMWSPVLLGPLIIILGVLSLLTSAVVPIYLVVLAVALFAGLTGFFYHLRGALSIQGAGLTTAKIARIPIFLPLVWGFVSAIGLFAGYGLITD